MLALHITYMHAKYDHSSFSHARDMVGAHQNLNGSRDLTCPFQGQFAIHWLTLAKINLSIKFKVSIPTHYKDMNIDTKQRKCGGSR